MLNEYGHIPISTGVEERGWVVISNLNEWGMILWAVSEGMAYPQLQIGDAWKTVTEMKVQVGGAWKDIIEMEICVLKVDPAPEKRWFTLA